MFFKIQAHFDVVASAIGVPEARLAIRRDGSIGLQKESAITQIQGIVAKLKLRPGSDQLGVGGVTGSGRVVHSLVFKHGTYRVIWTKAKLRASKQTLMLVGQL